MATKRSRSSGVMNREPVLKGEIEIGGHYTWARGTRYETLLRVTGIETGDMSDSGDRKIACVDVDYGITLHHTESKFRDSCAVATRKEIELVVD